jgi:hypothetical protein
MRSHDPDLPNNLQIQNSFAVSPDPTNTTLQFQVTVTNNSYDTSPSTTLHIDITYTGANSANQPTPCTTAYTLTVPSVEPNGWWATPELPFTQSNACRCVPGQCEGVATVQLIRGPRPTYTPCNTYIRVFWHRDGMVEPQGFVGKQGCPF